MENITIAPQERKSLIIEMKHEAKPTRRLRMHIALLAFDGLSPTESARVLLCSRTTVYAVVSRFLRDGRAAFDDHRRRGPRPLLGEKASERVEKLLEEDSPTKHGWLSWSCELLALQLLRERASALVSRETLRRALHRLGLRWRRPRPPPPEKGSEEQIIEKHARLEDVLQMTEEAGSFFQDAYPSWRLTPRWACAECAWGGRCPLALRGPTARHGLAGRSTSRRGASIGCAGAQGRRAFRQAARPSA